MKRRAHRGTKSSIGAVLEREKTNVVRPGSVIDAAACPVNHSSDGYPLPGYVVAIMAFTMAVLFFWAHWSGISTLIQAWEREPDYSHGYLVAPIAALFLWYRRDRFPGFTHVPGWSGLVLLVASLLLLAAGKQFFLNPLIHWAMIVWIAGVTWMLAGRRAFYWALPSIGFLFFMVPLPFRSENWLSYPLQRVATHLSTWTLQILGQPAFAEGNTILLGSGRLEVAQACSGLRMLVMITALVVACCVLVCRNYPERVLLLFCILPVALFSNSVRIVATGLALQYISQEASETVHEIAGWIVVIVAASMMGFILMYWRRLIIESELTRCYQSYDSRLLT